MKLFFKLHKLFKIGGAIWNVVSDKHIVDAEHSERLCGKSEMTNKIIEVSLNEDPLDIFLHEMIHACLSFMGIEDEEADDETHRLVEAGAQVLRMILADNIDFWRDALDYLQADNEGKLYYLETHIKDRYFVKK